MLAALSLNTSCQQEEAENLPEGYATFSISKSPRDNGRMKELSGPSFILFSMMDSHGNVRENIKLPLYSFGQSYMTEEFELHTGTYKLTQFAVLDETNKIIFATPSEGSALAQYVLDPLPIEFSVNENEDTHIIPQVLAVFEDDLPEYFGYASFGFEVVSPKLKSMSNYYTDASEVPSEKFMFFYDAQGRLSSFDRYGYVPGLETQQIRFSLEYFIEGSDLFYIMNVRSIVNGNPDSLLSKRKVYLDANANVVRDILYNFDPELQQEVRRETIYNRFSGGYTVIVSGWDLIGGYETPKFEFRVRKASYETDATGNITKQKIYKSDLESVESEYLFTNDSRINPLYNLTPYFTNFFLWERYAISQSQSNTLKMTPVGCEDESCELRLSYKYQNGYVTEVNLPGGPLLYKRTYEYY
jgi:hypothetical protein